MIDPLKLVETYWTGIGGEATVALQRGDLLLLYNDGIHPSSFRLHPSP